MIYLNVVKMGNRKHIAVSSVSIDADAHEFDNNHFLSPALSEDQAAAQASVNLLRNVLTNGGAIVMIESHP